MASRFHLFEVVLARSFFPSFRLWIPKAVQRSALCRSRRELSNAYLLAKFGFVTAENEPLKVCLLSAYRSLRSPAIRFGLGSLHCICENLLGTIGTDIAENWPKRKVEHALLFCKASELVVDLAFLAQAH